MSNSAPTGRTQHHELRATVALAVPVVLVQVGAMLMGVVDTLMVGRVSAAVFTVSYTQALLACVFSGAAWDLGGSPRFAFLPMAINSLPLLFLPPLMRFRRSQPTS